MSLAMHPAYGQLIEKAQASHDQGRRLDLFDEQDIDLARLYSYAFRTHTIGAFHATREALAACAVAEPLAAAHVQRATEHLEDLANQGMEPPRADARAVIWSCYHYDRHVRRSIDALEQALASRNEPALSTIHERFVQSMSQITGGNGIYLTQDTGAPPQASFIVPNLGITIVPLVYGDHHSWNLAHLNEQHLDVPMHRHRHGVEIHLGFAPLEGYMVLGDRKAHVDEGYAMPIPPMTRHGWANTTGKVHHVPFIFGSLKQSGWGVFLDVEAQGVPVEELRTVERTSWHMGSSVYLQRQIAAMAKLSASRRQTLVPAASMDRDGSGGLELSASRVTESGLELPLAGFRIVSVVGGRGQVRIGNVCQNIGPHDHFGVPAGMRAHLKQDGTEPMVVLDALIKGVGGAG